MFYIPSNQSSFPDRNQTTHFDSDSQLPGKCRLGQGMHLYPVWTVGTDVHYPMDRALVSSTFAGSGFKDFRNAKSSKATYHHLPKRIRARSMIFSVSSTPAATHIVSCEYRIS